MAIDFSYIDHDILGDVADAIRFVEGSTAGIAPTDYPQRIRALDNYIPDYDVLNFTLPNGGTISLNKIGNPTVVELEYWLDENRQWLIWQPDSNGHRSITLTAGQRMYVRNTSLTPTRLSTYNSQYYTFKSQDSVIANGIIESMLCKNPNIVTQTFDWSFNNLLRDMPLTGIVTSVSQTINFRAFYLTFINSSPSGFVFRNATTINSEGLEGWMINVGGNGVIYCKPELTLLANSASGIPVGWTRQDI